MEYASGYDSPMESDASTITPVASELERGAETKMTQENKPWAYYDPFEVQNCNLTPIVKKDIETKAGVPPRAKVNGISEDAHRVCGRISQILKDSSSKAKGSRMFQKRRRRSDKFSIEAYGTQPDPEIISQYVDPDEYQAESLYGDHPIDDDYEEEVYDDQSEQTDLTDQSNASCFGGEKLTDRERKLLELFYEYAMDISQMRGKGAKIFAKRHQRMEKFTYSAPRQRYPPPSHAGHLNGNGYTPRPQHFNIPRQNTPLRPQSPYHYTYSAPSYDDVMRQPTSPHYDDIDQSGYFTDYDSRPRKTRHNGMGMANSFGANYYQQHEPDQSGYFTDCDLRPIPQRRTSINKNRSIYDRNYNQPQEVDHTGYYTDYESHPVPVPRKPVRPNYSNGYATDYDDGSYQRREFDHYNLRQSPMTTPPKPLPWQQHQQPLSPNDEDVIEEEVNSEISPFSSSTHSSFSPAHSLRSFAVDENKSASSVHHVHPPKSRSAVDREIGSVMQRNGVSKTTPMTHENVEPETRQGASPWRSVRFTPKTDKKAQQKQGSPVSYPFQIGSKPKPAEVMTSKVGLSHIQSLNSKDQNESSSPAVTSASKKHVLNVSYKNKTNKEQKTIISKTEEVTTKTTKTSEIHSTKTYHENADGLRSVAHNEIPNKISLVVQKPISAPKLPVTPVKISSANVVLRKERPEVKCPNGNGVDHSASKTVEIISEMNEEKKVAAVTRETMYDECVTGKTESIPEKTNTLQKSTPNTVPAVPPKLEKSAEEPKKQHVAPITPPKEQESVDQPRVYRKVEFKIKPKLESNTTEVCPPLQAEKISVEAKEKAMKFIPEVRQESTVIQEVILTPAVTPAKITRADIPRTPTPPTHPSANGFVESEKDDYADDNNDFVKPPPILPKPTKKARPKEVPVEPQTLQYESKPSVAVKAVTFARDSVTSSQDFVDSIESAPKVSPEKAVSMGACIKLLDPSKPLEIKKREVLTDTPTMGAVLEQDRPHSRNALGYVRSISPAPLRTSRRETSQTLPRPSRRSKSESRAPPKPVIPFGGMAKSNAKPIGSLAEALRGKGAKIFEKQQRRMERYTLESEGQAEAPNHQRILPPSSVSCNVKPDTNGIKSGMNTVLGQFQSKSSPGHASRPSSNKKPGHNPQQYQQYLFYRPPSAADFVGEPSHDVGSSKSSEVGSHDGSDITVSTMTTDSMDNYNSNLKVLGPVSGQPVPRVSVSPTPGVFKFEPAVAEYLNEGNLVKKSEATERNGGTTEMPITSKANINTNAPNSEVNGHTPNSRIYESVPQSINEIPVKVKVQASAEAAPTNQDVSKKFTIKLSAPKFNVKPIGVKKISWIPPSRM